MYNLTDSVWCCSEGAASGEDRLQQECRGPQHPWHHDGIVRRLHPHGLLLRQGVSLQVGTKFRFSVFQNVLTREENKSPSSISTVWHNRNGAKQNEVKMHQQCLCRFIRRHVSLLNFFSRRYFQTYGRHDSYTAASARAIGGLEPHARALIMGRETYHRGWCCHCTGLRLRTSSGTGTGPEGNSHSVCVTHKSNAAANALLGITNHFCNELG